MQLLNYCTTFKNSIEIFRIKLKMANGNERNTQHLFKRHCFIEVLIHFLWVYLRTEKKNLINGIFYESANWNTFDVIINTNVHLHSRYLKFK